MWGEGKNGDVERKEKKMGQHSKAFSVLQELHTHKHTQKMEGDKIGLDC